MDNQELVELEQRFEMPLYPKRGIALVRGQGEFVWDADGKKYIDCTTGVGVAILGHAHPAVVSAMERQAGELMTCYEPFCNAQRARLLERLSGLFGNGRTFLCNSGTESV